MDVVERLIQHFQNRGGEKIRTPFEFADRKTPTPPRGA